MVLQMKGTTLYLDFAFAEQETDGYKFPHEIFNGLATAGGVQLLNIPSDTASRKGAVPAYTEITDSAITVNGVDGTTFVCEADTPDVLTESGG